MKKYLEEVKIDLFVKLIEGNMLHKPNDNGRMSNRADTVLTVGKLFSSLQLNHFHKRYMAM